MKRKKKWMISELYEREGRMTFVLFMNSIMFFSVI